MRSGASRIFSLLMGATLCLCVLPLSAQSAPAQSVTAPGEQSAPRPWDQNPNGMHIYLQAGLKTHEPGQHDYPTVSR